MKKENTLTIHIRSVAEQHQLAGVGKTKHPSFSILRFEDFARATIDQRIRWISDMYHITLKRNCPCKAKYGQTSYDFDEGIMSFFAPNQVVVMEPGDWIPESGWLLLIHPDFLKGTPMRQRITSYDFFEYAVHESLILSGEEEKSLEQIFQQMECEYQRPIDAFSRDVVISNLDLILTYCNRYYNRQFIVRKPDTHTLLSKFESLLNNYFKKDLTESGLPTVTYLATELNLSPKYLSDCLKQITGTSAQQHIHNALIEKAREKLAITDLSVKEIAHALGFGYSQSFSKFFKAKTDQSPLEYRQSMN